MSMFRYRSFLAAAAAVIAIAAGSGIAAQAAPQPSTSDRPTADTTLAETFKAVDRNTSWNMTGKLKLDFPAHHPQGIAYTDDHIFLSSVEIIERTVKYPTPRDGYDPTAGKGVGHVFVMDKAGNCRKASSWAKATCTTKSSSRSPTTSAASSWTARPVTWSETPGDHAGSPSGTSKASSSPPGRTRTASSTTRTAST